MKPVPFVCLASLAATAAADDASLEIDVGGCAQLTESHPSIRMVSETVRLNPAAGEVKATFVFHNEGKTVVVHMGFPEGPAAASKKHFLRFKTWVDGRLIPTRLVYGTEATEGEGEFKTRWRVKDVRFAQGQTRRVEVAYKVRLQPRDGTDDTGIYDMTALDYVLHTGAGWKGPIGSVRVVCDLTGLPKWRYTSFRPQPAKVTNESAVWQYRDLEPTNANDVEVKWFAGFTDIVLDDEYVDMTQAGLWDPQLKNPPVRREREVWVPAGAVTRWLDAPKYPVEGKRGVLLIRGSRKIEFLIGNSTAATDRGAVKLFARAYRGEGVVMVPLIAAARALGAGATWDAAGKDLVIVSPADKEVHVRPPLAGTKAASSTEKPRRRRKMREPF